jgi:hypothetical protein
VFRSSAHRPERRAVEITKNADLFTDIGVRVTDGRSNRSYRTATGASLHSADNGSRARSPAATAWTRVALAGRLERDDDGVVAVDVLTVTATATEFGEDSRRRSQGQHLPRISQPVPGRQRLQ